MWEFNRKQHFHVMNPFVAAFEGGAAYAYRQKFQIRSPNSSIKCK